MQYFHRPSPRPPARPTAGFTLVELLVTVAIVAVLMAGIASVFGIASETIKVAQSVSKNTRGIRALQTTLEGDLANYAPDAPLVIRSARTAAFRNAADEQADRDYQQFKTSAHSTRDRRIRTANLDNDFTNGVGGLGDEFFYPRFLYGERNFRLDRLTFFMRGDFRRQTGNPGNPGALVSDFTADQALVAYGHLRQPNLGAVAGDSLDDYTAGSNPDPGHGKFDTANVPDDRNIVNGRANNNNFYASDWILGRARWLMAEPEPVSSGELRVLSDNRSLTDAQRVQTYYGRPFTVIDNSIANRDKSKLFPLQSVADTFMSDPNFPADGLNVYSAFDGGDSDPFIRPDEDSLVNATRDDLMPIQTGRYDVIGASIETIGRDLERHVRLQPVAGNGTPIWWFTHFMNFRVQGYPQPARPLDARSFARTVPVMLESASHYAVEFAGDFLTQYNVPTDTTSTAASPLVYGDVTNLEPDGVLDYVVADVGGPTQTKYTRFYGMPRDVAGIDGPGTFRPEGDGVIRGNDQDPATRLFNNDLVDVVPLRDVVLSRREGIIPAVPGGPVPFMPYNFERLPPTANPAEAASTLWSDFQTGYNNNFDPYRPLGPKDVYADIGVARNQAQAGALDPGAESRDEYIAAWGPDTVGEPRPWLLRVVVGVAAEGRETPETYEFVVDLRR